MVEPQPLSQGLLPQGLLPQGLFHSPLVLPSVSIAAMSTFLAEFAATIPADTHVVMVLDQAGWHGARALVVPPNLTLVPLPPYLPELNPVERLWLYLRQRYLSHRLLDDYEAVIDACCHAWTALAQELGASSPSPATPGCHA